MQDAIREYNTINVFQSAPGLEAGRCYFGTHFSTRRVMFQSAPGLEAGRCRHADYEVHDDWEVSIRARP